MKKRLFAGVLAFLMVIGLLPLSMLYKPVSAKADGTGVYILNPNDISGNVDNSSITGIYENDKLSKYFTIYNGIKTGTKEWKGDKTDWTPSKTEKKYLQLIGTRAYKDNIFQKVIKFSTSTQKVVTSVKIWYYTSSTDRDICIYTFDNGEFSSEGDLINTEANKTIKASSGFYVKTFENLPAGMTYYLGSKKSSVNIYRIEAIEKPLYDIDIVDSKSSTKADGETTSVVEGKDCTLEAADADNFLYWVNSNNRIVSRDAKYTFPVYYADTYTAVYKSETPAVKFMTAYNQVYSTADVNDELTLPDGPFRYGYTFKGWSKTIDQIKEEADTSKSIEVKPVYELNVALFNVTINGETKQMNANTYVTAKSELGDKFAYWVDANNNNKILSYNSTYNFFVNGAIDVEEVKTDDIVDKVEAKGIINCVKQATLDTKSVIVFEYTVPEDCTIQFAGVVADESAANLTMDKAKFVGGEGTGSKNYRYTLSNSSGKTYNVKAVLKYTDSTGKVNEIESSVYTLN